MLFALLLRCYNNNNNNNKKDEEDGRKEGKTMTMIITTLLYSTLPRVIDTFDSAAKTRSFARFDTVLCAHCVFSCDGLQAVLGRWAMRCFIE